MFKPTKVNKKFRRKKEREDDEEIEEESSKKIKVKIQVLEEETGPKLDKKLAQNVQFEAREKVRGYDLEGLKNSNRKEQHEIRKKLFHNPQEGFVDAEELQAQEELKSEILVKSIVPDDVEIKKLLERKRSLQQKPADPVSNEPNFIPLESKSLAKRDDSSVETDREEDEDFEEFEDYKADKIAFGARAVKEQNQLELKQKTELLAQFQKDDEDDQFLEYEMETLRMGSKENQEIVALMKKKEKTTKKAPIPLPYIPMSLEEILNKVNLEIETLTADDKIFNRNIEMLHDQVESSKSELSKIEEKITFYSQRYEFFQDLSQYVLDLVEFTNVKLKLVEELERLYSERMQREFNINLKMQYDLLGTLEDSVQPMDDSEMERSEEELVKLREECFADSSKHFRKLKYVKGRFEAWKTEYEVEFTKAYGLHSIIDVFDMFIRFELLDWQPFLVFKSLEETDFFQELSAFGSDGSIDLLKACMEKTVISLFIQKITYFNVYHATPKAFKWISFFLDFFSIKSAVLQVIETNKNVLDAFEDTITFSINDLVNHVYKGNVIIETAEEKRSRVLFFVSYITQIMLWKKYFPIGVIKNWIFKLVIEGTLPLLEAVHDFDLDLDLYKQLSEQISTLMGDGYQTPPEFKKLEIAFLKNVYVRYEKQGDGSEIFYTKALKILEHMRSYEAASLINSKLKQIKS